MGSGSGIRLIDSAGAATGEIIAEKGCCLCPRRERQGSSQDKCKQNLEVNRGFHNECMVGVTISIAIIVRPLT